MMKVDGERIVVNNGNDGDGQDGGRSEMTSRHRTCSVVTPFGLYAKMI